MGYRSTGTEVKKEVGQKGDAVMEGGERKKDTGRLSAPCP